MGMQAGIDHGLAEPCPSARAPPSGWREPAGGESSIDMVSSLHDIELSDTALAEPGSCPGVLGSAV